MTVANAAAAYELARAAYEQAAQDLRDALAREVQKLAGKLPPKLLALAEAVSTEFQIDQADLLGLSRRREHIEPRHILFALSREVCPHYGIIALGSFFNRDHGTILNSERALRRLLETDSRYAVRVARIRAAVRDGEPAHAAAA